MANSRVCINKIIKNEGYLGFFKGFSSLFYRDTLSYGFYFLSFEYLRRKSLNYGIDNDVFRDLICGGLAGNLLLILIFILFTLATLISQ